MQIKEEQKSATTIMKFDVLTDKSSKLIADRIILYLGYSLPGLPQGETSDDWRRSSRNI